MKITITSILLICVNSLYSQSYIDYYNFCNEGDKQTYLKNDSLALENYEKAFKLVSYVHAAQYKKASMCAARVQDFQKTSLFAKNAILNGTLSTFLNQKDFKNYRKTDLYKSLKDSIFIFSNKHKQSINSVYKREIDSLYYIDQRIIRSNVSVTGNFEIDDSILNESNIILDSLVFERLLSLINQYGFPSEKNIGPNGYSNVYILFHHHIRKSQNAQCLEMAKEALMRGEYLPIDYAWMYDQSLMNKNEKPLFYYGGPYGEDLSDSEKMEIDLVRKKYGVKPLESTEFKRKRKFNIQKHLW